MTYLFIFAISLNLIIASLSSVCVPDTRQRSDDLAPDGNSYSAVFFNKSYTSDCGCDSKYTCVRKCCDEGYFIDLNEETLELKCLRNDSIKLSVPIYKMGNVIIDNNPIIDFRYLSGVNECLLDDDDKNAYTATMDEFYIQKNGKLWMSSLNTYFKPEHYCLEYDEDNGPIAYLCLLSYDVQSLEISSRITVIGMMISLPFLLVTFIVYGVLPLRNLHGKALMCYIFSLFTTYLLYIIIQLHPDAESLDAVLCKTLGKSNYVLNVFMVMNKQPLKISISRIQAATIFVYLLHQKKQL
uniref:Methuselah N-terminal domain-containing protein n=1 Tax=Photinus pyralis TaxID=7054 RepID=A0A1Y1LU33_PHOPY